MTEQEWIKKNPKAPVKDLVKWRESQIDVEAEKELEIRKQQRMSASSWLSVTSLDEACRLAGWSLDKKMEILAELAKDDTDRRNQLAAVRYLDECIERTLEVTGGIRKVKVTSQGEDGTVTEDQFVENLAATAVRHTEVTIEPDKEIIDAEVEEKNDEQAEDGTTEDGPEELSGPATAPEWGQRPPSEPIEDGFGGLCG